MNALARSDLRQAYEFAQSFRKAWESGALPDAVKHSTLGSTIEAVEKLCHVCQALSEENEELRRELEILKDRKIPHGYICHSS